MPSTQVMAKFRLVITYVVGIFCGMWLQPDSKILLGSSKSENVDLQKVDRKLDFEFPLAASRDEHKHHDDDRKAKELFDKVKVLVWVMTMKEHHVSKALAVKNTWGKHCNKVLFMSDAEDKELPAIAIYNKTGRQHLTGKTMKAFDYIYKHYLEEYDWFMKADDDTYIVLENLRYMLSEEDPGKPVFFGLHFRPNVKQGYFSGGAGYVISKEALRRFGKRDGESCTKDGGAEDVEFAKCMEKYGVSTGDTRDSLNRTRFHCFGPAVHLKGGYPEWFFQYDKFNGTSKGEESISDYAISFHYLNEHEMAKMEFFLYHLRPYGISSGLQDLNKAKSDTKSSKNS